MNHPAEQTSRGASAFDSRSHMTKQCALSLDNGGSMRVDLHPACVTLYCGGKIYTEPTLAEAIDAAWMDRT